MRKKINELPGTIRSALYDRSIILLISLVVMIFGLLTSYLFATNISSSQSLESSESRRQQIEALSIYIESRMSSYREVVRSAAGMVHVKGRDNLTRADWEKFTSIVRTADAIEQVQGVGLSDVFTSKERATYHRTINSDYSFPVELDPTTPRSTYTAIRYLSPLDDENKRAIGYDMFSEPVRRAAMTTARDKAEVAMTAPVVSVQDETKDRPPTSLLMYYPLYTDRTIPQTTEERRNRHIGYTYAVLRPIDVIEPYIEANDIRYEFALHDVEDKSDKQHIYSTEGYDNTAENTTTSRLLVNGRSWDLALHAKQAPFFSTINPLLYFIFGLLGSSVLAYATYALLTNRQNTLSDTYTKQLEQTRLDLLALASHQLRTPATGTRQYLSMLLDGYFGDLKDDQQDIARRAYIANERQLEIVDDILYVVKAETGQLLLVKSSVDLIELLHDVVRIHEKQAAKKDISVSLVSVHKHLETYGDEKYLRMIFENILSNALKYSHPGSPVSIRVTKHSDTARIIFRDKGVGIAQEDFENLFVKFNRIENPLSHSEGGSGLGLYLTKKLVDAHGGTIDVSSKKGRGSSFTITLPLRKTELSDKNVVQLTE